MSSLGDIIDDVNPVDETPPDVLAPMELSKSRNSNQWDEDEDEEWDEDEIDSQYDEDEHLNSVPKHILDFVNSVPKDILDFVGDLLKGSTQIVDEVVQGGEVPTEKKEEKGPPTFAGWIYLHFFPTKMDPLFRQIVCEMKTCKNGVEPDEKAQTILNMLRKYSWRGKAVLTLAAFAVVFGDICVFAKFHHLVYEQVLKSSAIQKGEPFFANSSELLKRQVIIHQLKEIIETILQVMQKMKELPKPLQMDEIYNPIITTVVACAIEVSNLTNDRESDESQNLSPYLKQIQEQQIILEKERDEFINHREAIKKLQDSRTDTVEILKAMFFLNDNQPELIDASASHEPVKIDVLRGKYVFLFISSLDNVSEDDILDLNVVYEKTMKDNEYTIVWIPIVEEWTDELRNKLDTILSFSNQMFWYVLPSFSLSVNGIRFIKAHWYFTEPALVLLNPQGNLENPNVIHDIYHTSPPFLSVSHFDLNQATMSSLGDIVDDVNPVDETAPDVLALMELFKSQNSNQSAFTKYEDLKSIPYDSLNFVGDLIKGSTQIVDEVLQGSEAHAEKEKEKRPTTFTGWKYPHLSSIFRTFLGCEAHAEKEKEKGPTTFTGWKYLHFFSSKMDPLFKQIVCEMKACKNEVEPDEKAKTILNMLPKYLWREKAKLTLAAFAVVFGDFCVFAKIHHLVYEQVLKSLAIQKGVPFFANSSELFKRQVIIHQIKEIIETILQVMQKIDWYLREPLKMEEIVNLIITTVVACAIEVSNLTNDKKSDESQNLSPYLKQIQEVFNTIEKEQDEFTDHCEAIKKLQDSCTDTVEILKTKFFLNDSQPELIDASASHEPVKIDVLRGKNVFLFISSLDNVSKNEILDLKAVYEETKKDNDYTIVWIPIVEEWTDELRNKLHTILSFSHQMCWYVLPSFSLSVNGIKFIKDNWYDKWPKLVLLNPQGNLENPNVFDDIRWYGMKFFPFDKKTIGTKIKSPKSGAAIPIKTKKEKCFFFYGGEDDKWIQQFTEKATAVAEDTFLKGKYIKIEYFYIGDSAKGKALHRTVGKLWASVVARLFSANHNQVDPVTQEIKKLLSNESLSQWAVLCKDSSVVISGDGSRFLTVLDEFDQWKEALDEKSFDITFKEYHEARTNPQ